ncbi:hypothetical protein PFISCL1PPCAC_9429, partial [Pristionchus fissidentatus]
GSTTTTASPSTSNTPTTSATLPPVTSIRTTPVLVQKSCITCPALKRTKECIQDFTCDPNWVVEDVNANSCTRLNPKTDSHYLIRLCPGKEAIRTASSFLCSQEGVWRAGLSPTAQIVNEDCEITSGRRK